MVLHLRVPLVTLQDSSICENNATFLTVVTGDFIAITTGASTEISKSPSTSNATVTQSIGLSVHMNKEQLFQLSMIFAQIMTFLISV